MISINATINPITSRAILAYIKYVIALTSGLLPSVIVVFILSHPLMLLYPGHLKGDPSS